MDCKRVFLGTPFLLRFPICESLNDQKESLNQSLDIQIWAFEGSLGTWEIKNLAISNERRMLNLMSFAGTKNRLKYVRVS